MLRVFPLASGLKACLAKPGWWALLVLLGLLSACGSAPKTDRAARSADPGRDGPAAQIPPDLAATPDAEPRVEALRTGGPNKPYEVLGQSYTPETRDRPLRERGLASWYGRKFHGRKTASGEIYDMHAMTAAHKTMPLPSYARVRNPANGREVVVRVNDRGPFVAGRIIDLSYTAALKLDMLRGVAPVEVERLTFDDIRTGAWRRNAPGTGNAIASTSPSPALPPLPRAMADVSPGAEPAAMPAGPTPAADAPTPTSMAADPASPQRAPSAVAPGWWVQLGAFRDRSGAEGFQQRVAAELDWLAPLLALVSEAPLWRLQAGPYPSRDEAQSAAQRVRESLQLVPVVVEKR